MPIEIISGILSVVGGQQRRWRTGPVQVAVNQQFIFNF
jgi:hypothetical protein